MITATCNSKACDASYKYMLPVIKTSPGSFRGFVLHMYMFCSHRSTVGIA